MSEWTLKLDKYKINTQRYFELKAKCKQYKDWEKSCDEKSKRNIIAVNTALNTVLVKTGTLDLYDFLIKAITYQETLTKLQTYYCVKLSKNKYYEIRRMFFYELDKLVD